ncbi:hypothetical protein Pcinc_007225 [Petrolisthes cinctipes]|uniref:Uncharacterized protein n=1 Tax=Petrolisthes cinctipes TaxID=88211 RepID=A0AAE1G9U6_PETCI|nr:hypothetical protein Pcinc_007225 [Petrolisthes cinctipes]
MGGWGSHASSPMALRQVKGARLSGEGREACAHSPVDPLNIGMNIVNQNTERSISSIYLIDKAVYGKVSPDQRCIHPSSYSRVTWSGIKLDVRDWAVYASTGGSSGTVPSPAQSSLEPLYWTPRHSADLLHQVFEDPRTIISQASCQQYPDLLWGCCWKAVSLALVPFPSGGVGLQYMGCRVKHLPL